MNFYKHYKDKPYQVRGVAKHSESLEEFVVYETLYDNPTAKLWIRPRQMFEESITIEGKIVPRFEKIDITIEQTTELQESPHLELIARFMKEIFGEWDAKWFHGTFANHPRRSLWIASIRGQAVAFKLGYELDEHTFYSWLGGVLPAYRGLGIASDLMEAQHQWCRERGYRTIQTKTQNRWKNQLLLNIKSGFEITGYHASDEAGPKIMLEKKL
jgi:GNAT superfamily N-acetyltransferase